MTFARVCPIPLDRSPSVLLAHGGGGRLMAQLIEKLFLAAFDPDGTGDRHDSHVFETTGGRLAFTTDSYVVRPLFFPGGDIGKLAVHGTVNDLAMAGARPLALSAGFILEEGLSMETLWRVACSMAESAASAGVRIATGDTKVVERGKADGLYINTSGVGRVEAREPVHPSRIKAGDAVIVSGDVGRHALAVTAERQGLSFETPVESDTAAVHEPVLDLLREGIDVHCLRDLTRGGLGAVLNELASAARVTVRFREADVPVHSQVRAACEILGFDPLQMANEGRFVLFVPSAMAERALFILKRFPVSSGASIIGRVSGAEGVPVLAENSFGSQRVIDVPAGEPFPRIC